MLTAEEKAAAKTGHNVVTKDGDVKWGKGDEL